ncbi:hypothetical protein GTY82_24300 [Streptomyces sp. SID5476]|uniref:Uncharacterized protein n=1 Tax=Streptomyces bottropensis ATCC 25435 TaxID=1054862 RepID=M3F5U7_9ACTN|nr:hypothetical protein SBD_1519 [Streptomyces bottropensis ATCC 25435]MZD20316.1 hypothetical protein [Streptomyces sp. SID5476]
MQLTTDTTTDVASDVTSDAETGETAVDAVDAVDDALLSELMKRARTSGVGLSGPHWRASSPPTLATSMASGPTSVGRSATARSATGW